MISIIIPVYNEEKNIRRVLQQFPHQNGLEIIVVDGGSRDKTVEFARQFPVKLIQATRNRVSQMNAGASLAEGDMFLFLHADCLLERGGLEEMAKNLSDGCIGGCFLQRIDSGKPVYRLIEVSGNIRAKIFKVFYGDQAIFVRRDAFFKAGGFDAAGLFEDIKFSKKLKCQGKVTVLNKRVSTLPRRWETQGIIRTTLINWLLTFGFMLGLPPNILKRIYRDIR